MTFDKIEGRAGLENDITRRRISVQFLFGLAFGRGSRRWRRRAKMFGLGARYQSSRSSSFPSLPCFYSTHTSVTMPLSRNDAWLVGQLSARCPPSVSSLHFFSRYWISSPTTPSFRLPLCGAGHLSLSSWSHLFFTLCDLTA